MINKRLRQYLADQGVSYTHGVHPPAYTATEMANQDHTPPSKFAKTIAFVADGCFGVAVLPADTRVELHELRQALGARNLRLATEPELEKLFPDVEVGSMSPFGNLYGLAVYVDERLTQQPWIAFEAGTYKDTLHMRYSDFARLVEPLVLSFSEASV